MFGGDGSIGWVLSTVDKYNLHSKVCVVEGGWGVGGDERLGEGRGGGGERREGRGGRGKRGEGRGGGEGGRGEDEGRLGEGGGMS